MGDEQVQFFVGLLGWAESTEWADGPCYVSLVFVVLCFFFFWVGKLSVDWTTVARDKDGVLPRYKIFILLSHLLRFYVYSFCFSLAD